MAGDKRVRRWKAIRAAIRGHRGRAELRRLAASTQTDQTPLRLVIGASQVFESGWVGTEIETLNLLRPSHWERCFRPASIDALLAEHVWEHLTVKQGTEAAARCHEYLKPGGYLRLAVPDGYHPDAGYRDAVRPGGTGPGADDRRVLYSHQLLTAILEHVGFQVRLLEYFDADGQFHAEPWEPADGKILRSMRFDRRNRDGQLGYTSLMVDAIKPAAAARLAA